jgi:hypothetical protein
MLTDNGFLSPYASDYLPALHGKDCTKIIASFHVAHQIIFQLCTAKISQRLWLRFTLHISLFSGFARRSDCTNSISSFHAAHKIHFESAVWSIDSPLVFPAA